jgi:hypothetical protein
VQVRGHLLVQVRGHLLVQVRGHLLVQMLVQVKVTRMHKCKKQMPFSESCLV